MCGICGKVAYDVDLEKKELDKLIRSLSHRGPDGEGSYTSKRIGLGMRRLSIIDLSGGKQPLFNEDKTVVVFGNGEIYNYVELGKTLKQKGHKFRTGSDIEMAAHCYEEYGDKFVSKLRGMFVLVLYDKKRQKLLIVRDRMGEKPLYFTETTSGFYFASEMKSLLKIKDLNKQLDRSALDKYFHYYYIPEPETAFESVSKLGAGQMIKFDLDTYKYEVTTYWDPGEIKDTFDGDPTTKIKKVFSESCVLTLRSDVPVGIALSGGIDSGAILSFAAPAYKETMKAFSIGYKGEHKSDEREMARKLAKKFKVEFIEKEINDKEVVDHFPQLVFDGDDPIADIAGHSIWSVNKLARDNGVKVLLGGVGGDELFWGYPWMTAAIEKTLERFAGEGNVFELLNRLISSPDFEYMDFYNTITPYLSAEKVITRLYTREFKGGLNKWNSLLPMKVSGKSQNLVAKKALELIRDAWLKSNVIALNDRLSMAASVELRSPFLDYKLVETVLSSKKALNGWKKDSKYWFKLAMKGVLPDEVMNRPKRGFTPPVALWVRKLLNRYIRLLDGGFLWEEKILSEKGIKLLRNTWKGMPMHWYAFYQVVLLEIWGREYVYGQKPKELM